MFQIIEAEDVVRVEPLNFSESLNKMAEKMLKIKYESTLSPDFGYIVLIIDVCLLYTSPSPRDATLWSMPSCA